MSNSQSQATPSRGKGLIIAGSIVLGLGLLQWLWLALYAIFGVVPGVFMNLPVIGAHATDDGGNVLSAVLSPALLTVIGAALLIPGLRKRLGQAS